MPFPRCEIVAVEQGLRNNWTRPVSALYVRKWQFKSERNATTGEVSSGALSVIAAMTNQLYLEFRFVFLLPFAFLLQEGIADPDRR
jgi:hypothetical protein